jgi:hypothetical protein
LVFSKRNILNSTAALGVILFSLFLFVLFWLRAEWPAGGQDSWNHYLYARFAGKHPFLFGEQWGKPFFTLIASPFARFGIQGVYLMNTLCVLLTAWVCYLTAQRLNMRLSWLAALYFIFQPIVFGNTISGLTEPLNALFLSIILYLLASHRFIAAALCASFLPFFRSEGFVLMVAIAFYFIIKRRWKELPWLFSGTFVLAIAGAALSGDLGWILTHNPYYKAEVEQRFDPGHGEFLHYANAFKQIWGIVVVLLAGLTLLLLLAHTVYLLQRKTPEEKSRFGYWLLIPLFFSFFFAHSWLWYTGSYGSHGLIRVFLMVAPVTALLAQYATDKLLSVEIKWFTRIFVSGMLLSMVYYAYKGSGTPWPWKNTPTVAAFPGEPQINKAIVFIKSEQLDRKVLLHQLPWLNAQLNLDPWETPEKAQTYYIWSIDKQPGKDWMPDSSVVLWDNFHARRDAPMPLSDMRKLTEYKELAYFPAKDSIYDVRVFLKVKNR